MNQTLQLTDYIPQYVSLYYVDYRDDLDEHEDIQEECIRSNNMEKLYEKAYEWYEEQESSNMHDYLEETRKNMETDNLAGEFEEHEDEIRELIYDRNDSDPVKDLIRNSSVTNFFYSLGVEISGYLTGCSLRGESVAMACHKVRRALHLKKGQFDEKIEELTDRLTRQMAEFDNFRKRTEKEKSQMYEVGAKDIIEKILPVVDNFERGLDAVPEEEKEDPFIQGMEKVYKQFMTVLESVEVKPIEALGNQFDPNFHNAVMHVEDENFGENEVAEEFQKGYMYRDSVVRHSMVKVAN